MNKFWIITLFILGRLLLYSPLNAEMRLLRGDLASLTQAFIEQIPKENSRGYHRPQEEEISDMVSIVSSIMANEADQALKRASIHNYDIFKFLDLETQQVSIVLMERPNREGDFNHAWGLYIFAPDSPGHIIVETPHPLSEINIEKAAVEIFRTGKAKALLIAGAHRDANMGKIADMAHADQSVFQAIHQWLLSPGIIIYQPHGFDQEKYLGYGEVVVSAGVPSPTDLQKKLVQDLMNVGFSPCLFDGLACAKLGAQNNVQGNSAFMNGSNFIHTEINLEIRQNPDKLRLLMYTIANTLDQWTSDLPEEMP